MLQLPVTVIDNLDQARPRDIGQLGGPQADAHAIACAHQRGWALAFLGAVRADDFG